MIQKGFAPIVFLTLIVLGIAVFFGYTKSRQTGQLFMATPTPVPTPDTTSWSTYSNSLFTFKYDDKEYKIQPYSESGLSKDNNENLPKDFIDFMGYNPPKVINAINVTAILAPGVIPAGGDSSMQIWVFDNKDSLNIDQWYEKYIYYPLTWGKSIKSVFEQERPKDGFMVDDIKGKQHFVDAMGEAKYGYLSRDDKMYFFFGRNIEYDEKKDSEVIPNQFSQILSTFKFTK
jgi:hypothetical protein